jgi:hypothetical protein
VRNHHLWGRGTVLGCLTLGESECLGKFLVGDVIAITDNDLSVITDEPVIRVRRRTD